MFSNQKCLDIYVSFPGSYEASLQKNPTPEVNGDFTLRETHRCWTALEQCWSEGIYIEALGHKFWKVSLQVLSRYATWATHCTQVSDKKKVQVFFTLFCNLATLILFLN